MTEYEIFDKVQEIFRDVFDDENLGLSRETSASDIEDWDSLAQIRLVLAMEKQFNIKLSMQELKGLANVGGILDLITRKI